MQGAKNEKQEVRGYMYD